MWRKKIEMKKENKYLDRHVTHSRGWVQVATAIASRARLAARACCFGFPLPTPFRRWHRRPTWPPLLSFEARDAHCTAPARWNAWRDALLVRPLITYYSPKFTYCSQQPIWHITDSMFIVYFSYTERMLLSATESVWS